MSEFVDRSGNDEVIPMGEIPESTALPDGPYTVRVTQISQDQTDKGKKRFKSMLRVEGGQYDNAPIFDQFVIGSDSDLDAVERETWKRFPAVQWGLFCKACGVPKNITSRNEIFAMLQGQRLVVVLKQDTYEGVIRNKITRYAFLGELDASAPKANGPIAAAPAAARPVAGGEGFE